MPSGNTQYQFAEWLASAPTQGYIVEAITLTWFDSASIIYANHISSERDFINELGVTDHCLPWDFEVSVPDKDASTDGTITISGPSGGGSVRLLFGYLRGDEAQGINMKITYRQYLMPLYAWTPSTITPLQCHVTSISYSNAKIIITASTPRLPKQRAGIPYTIEEYPGLLGT